MEVFSLASLNKLSVYISSNQSDTRIVYDFESLSEEFEIQYLPLQFDLDPTNIDLLLPSDNKSESDKENLKTIYNAFNHLTPAQATDERIWATLSVRYFSEYTLLRWPLPNNESKVAKHIKSHWLCGPGVRSRVRDNSISRLWWMGYLVHQLGDWHPDEVSDVLFNNSDYRASIVERSSSASSYNVVGAILSITKEAFNNGIQYNRENFRSFMKEVNYIAGRSNLAALTQVQLIGLLRPIYHQCYSKKKSGKRDGGIFSIFR